MRDELKKIKEYWLAPVFKEFSYSEQRDHNNDIAWLIERLEKSTQFKQEFSWVECKDCQMPEGRFINHQGKIICWNCYLKQKAKGEQNE